MKRMARLTVLVMAMMLLLTCCAQAEGELHGYVKGQGYVYVTLGQYYQSLDTGNPSVDGGQPGERCWTWSRNPVKDLTGVTVTRLCASGKTEVLGVDDYTVSPADFRGCEDGTYLIRVTVKDPVTGEERSASYPVTVSASGGSAALPLAVTAAAVLREADLGRIDPAAAVLAAGGTAALLLLKKKRAGSAS